MVDTHSLVWYLQDNPRLSAENKSRFESGQALVIVPTIVLAELLYIAKRVKMSFGDTLSLLEQSPVFEFHSLNVSIIKIAAKFPHLEIHDSLIAATAKSLLVPLMTADKAIKRSGLVATI